MVYGAKNTTMYTLLPATLMVMVIPSPSSAVSMYWVSITMHNQDHYIISQKVIFTLIGLYIPLSTIAQCHKSFSIEYIRFIFLLCHKTINTEFLAEKKKRCNLLTYNVQMPFHYVLNYDAINSLNHVPEHLEPSH